MIIMLEVNIITSKEQINNCPKYHINNFQWNCVYKPEAYAQLAYLDKEGFYINMVCIEANPKRIYTNPHDPVCKDSTMEAFFAFVDSSNKIDDDFVPDNDCMYLNFEMNANGALYAKYGKGRKPRFHISEEIQSLCNCKAIIDENSWSVSALIPLELLDELYGIKEFNCGDIFFCNLYKISESSEIEHYASYNPIISDTPNFHLPQFFDKACIVNKI